MVIATIDFDTQTSLQLFDVVIKRPTQAQQASVVCGLRLISRVSMFKLFLFNWLTDLWPHGVIKRSLPKLFTPQNKGASVAVDIGGAMRGNTRPAGQAGQKDQGW